LSILKKKHFGKASSGSLPENKQSRLLKLHVI